MLVCVIIFSFFSDSEMAFDDSCFDSTPKECSKIVVVSRGEDDMLPLFCSEDNSVEMDSPQDIEAHHLLEVCQEIRSDNSTPGSSATRRQDCQEIRSDNSTPESSVTRRRKSSPREENARKRQRCPAKWKNNISKQAYNSGIAHVTPRNFSRKARQLGQGCRAGCKKCSRKLTLQEREVIFKHFWKLPNVTCKRS